MVAISVNLKKASVFVVVSQHNIKYIIAKINSGIGFKLNYFFLKFLSIVFACFQLKSYLPKLKDNLC